MKKWNKVILVVSISVLAVAFLAFLVMWGNNALTSFIEDSNIVCKNQKFMSAEEAIEAMEITYREENDISLDYCPPYRVVYTFKYDNNTIVIYNYCYDFDGEESTSYAVKILKHNDDGTLSFDSGFAELKLDIYNDNENYYYFTNIHTTEGDRSISFLYLPKDSNKSIYVDGIKSEKILVSIDGNEFYLCYSISDRDTFLSNLFTPISDRHEIEIK